MRVVFTKRPGTAYEVAVHRDVGPELEPRNGVGGHEYLPHDLVHFVVEAETGISRGVFGELAAGGTGIFWPADPAQRRKAMRHRKKSGPYPSQTVEADHDRSEQLLRAALAEWERRRGMPGQHTAYTADTVDDAATVDRIVTALDVYAQRWYALPVGGTLTLTW